MDAMAIIDTLLRDNNSDSAIGVFTKYVVTVGEVRYCIVAAYMGGGKWDLDSIEEQPF